MKKRKYLFMILPALAVLNLLFGWIFLGFRLMFLTEIALVFGIMFLFIFSLSKKAWQDYYNVEDFLPEQEPEDWKCPVFCPKCESKKVRFLKFRRDEKIYKCLSCKIDFEDDAKKD